MPPHSLASLGKTSRYRADLKRIETTRIFGAALSGVPMSITFTCPNCGRSFTVDDRMAGKRGKCKSCGGAIRVPEPASESSPIVSAADLYGLEDAPAVASSSAREELTVLPRQTGGRGGAESAPKARAKKKRSGGGEPWGVGFRKAGFNCLIVGIFITVFLKAVPQEYRSHPGMVVALGSVLLVDVVGVLLTIVSVVGALVAFLSGNTRAFSCDSLGEGSSWGTAIFLTCVFIAGFIQGYNQARGRIPGRPPALGGMPAMPASSGGGNPSLTRPFGSEVRSDAQVTLSNGRVMRNTTSIGTASPGVEIHVDYQINRGELAPGEHFVLVIKSSKGRGELDNLHEMQFKPSGTIGASSFLARPEEGPFEAWLEIASMPGNTGVRKTVSSTVPLEFVDVPTRDLAAEARARMEAQQRQLMAPPQMVQPGGPGFAPSGPPMGPRQPFGPRGPRGPRFGPR